MEKQLSPDEVQAALWQGVLSPKDPQGNDLPFQSPEAEKAYKESILRFKAAIQMKELPDRVPVTVFPNMFPWTYAGMTIQEAMYDYGACAFTESRWGMTSFQFFLAGSATGASISLKFFAWSFVMMKNRSP